MKNKTDKAPALRCEAIVSHSETPRSDAAIETVDVAFVSYDGLASEPEKFVSPDFARGLERENNALREALSAYVNADDWTKTLEDQAISALANSRGVPMPTSNQQPDNT